MSLLGLFGGNSSSSSSSTNAATSEAQNTGVATAPILTANGAITYTNEFPAALADAFKNLTNLAGTAIQSTQQTQQLAAQPVAASVSTYAPIIGLVAVGFFVMEIFIHKKGR